MAVRVARNPMPRRRPIEIKLKVLYTFIAACASLLIVRDSAARKVTVHGRSQLEVQVARRPNEAVVSGTLLEDNGRPIGDAQVLVTFTRHDDPIAKLGPIATPTDERGAFLLLTPLPHGIYDIETHYGGDKLTEACDQKAIVDLGRVSLALSFSDKVTVLHLDDLQLLVRAKLTAIDELAVERTHGGKAPPNEGGAVEGIPSFLHGLTIRLQDENDRVLASALTTYTGEVELRFAPDTLMPGRGELRLSFAGTTELGPALQARAIERHARVHLQLASPASAEDPEQGIAVTAHASWTRGPVSSGTLEAYVGPLLVGAAALDGKASTPLVVKFGVAETRADTDNIAELRVHFRPNDPYFEPGNDATTTLQLAGPSPLRHAPLFLAAALVVGWLALGRRAKAQVPLERTAADLTRRPSIVVAQPLPQAQGHRGTVYDAHDGQPIGGALLRVLQPSFQGESELFRTTTDADGIFRIPAIATGAAHNHPNHIGIDAPTHAFYKQRLPQTGELRVYLVSRRRHVLARFVKWARGRYGTGGPDPTPLQIAARAKVESERQFADKVGDFVYAPGVASAQDEAEALALLPEPGPNVGGARYDAVAEALGRAQAGRPKA